MKILLLIIISLISVNAFAQIERIQLRSINEIFLTDEENIIANEIKSFETFLTSKNIPVNLSNLVFSVQTDSPSIFNSIYVNDSKRLATCHDEYSIRHISFSKKVMNDKSLKSTVWHELAHCLFNLKHNLRDVESIMFPYNDPIKFKKSQKQREYDFIEELRTAQFNVLYDLNVDNLMQNKYEGIILVDFIKVRRNQISFTEEILQIADLAIKISQINAKQITAQDHRNLVKFIEIGKKIK